MENIKEEINGLNRFQSIIKIIKDLYQNYKGIDAYIDYYNYQGDLATNSKRETYTLDEVTAAVLDFYKQLDPEYYMIVKKVFSEDKIRLYYKHNIDPKNISNTKCNIYKDINPEAVEYLYSESKVLYDYSNYKIFLPLKGTIDDFYSLAHELMHVIVWENTQHDKFSTTSNMLVETPSRIVENLLDYYLLEQTNNREEIIQYRLNRLLITQRDIKYTYFTDCLLQHINAEKENKAGDIEELVQQTGFTYSDAEISDFKNILKSEKYYLEGVSRYIVGDIVGLEFVDLFKEDRIAATQVLKNLVKNIGNLEVEKSLALIGININNEEIKSNDREATNKFI